MVVVLQTLFELVPLKIADLLKSERQDWDSLYLRQVNFHLVGFQNSVIVQNQSHGVKRMRNGQTQFVDKVLAYLRVYFLLFLEIVLLVFK